MSKTLELEVTGRGTRLKAFLGKYETDLEADATEIVGEPVDVLIFEPKSGTETSISRSTVPGSLKMAVTQIQKGTEWKKALESLTASVSGGRSMGSLLIVEQAFVNDPEFQSKVFSQDFGKHLRLLVNDKVFETEQFLVTFRDLFSSLLTEAVEEEPHAEERKHPPYLRVSRSIRDEVSGRLDACWRASGVSALTSTTTLLAGSTSRPLRSVRT